MSSILRIVFGRHAFFAYPASLNEVAALRAFIVAQVGEVTPLAEMERLSARNPDWLHAVVQEGAWDYAGAFAVLPLNAEAAARFNDNAMTGSQITLDHVVPETADASALYLGSILADKKMINRGATLAAFRRKMNEMRAGRPVPVYTRPVSADGLRIVTGMGYRPVRDEPHGIGEMIYRLG